MGERYDAVITDYGGVLTSSTRASMKAFCDAEGIDHKDFVALMVEWLSPDAEVNPMHQLETGALTGTEFEQLLATKLRKADGAALVADGLLTRMFAASTELPAIVDALHIAKTHGYRIGLLSNSWANDYPTHLWGDLFDDMVVSGEVGLRKPDVEIYELAASRLGVEPARCVFIDDIGVNVKGAVAAGMTAILHTDTDVTLQELSVLLEIPLQ